jgi:hypothetical protein
LADTRRWQVHQAASLVSVGRNHLIGSIVPSSIDKSLTDAHWGDTPRHGTRHALRVLKQVPVATLKRHALGQLQL